VSRFYVTELEGFRDARVGKYTPGLSCVVLDRAWNYRGMATFESERRIGNHGERLGHDGARRLAAERCAELNAKYG
jgi:hypothetical protein